MNRKDRDLGIQLLNNVPKRSCQDRLADPTPSTWQSAFIKDKTSTSANVMYFVSAIPLLSKSHINMVTVLANLSAECDNSYSDEPFSIKQAISLPYWK